MENDVNSITSPEDVEAAFEAWARARMEGLAPASIEHELRHGSKSREDWQAAYVWLSAPRPSFTSAYCSPWIETGLVLAIIIALAILSLV